MVGKDQLSQTSLHKLGLLSGKVAIRVKVQTELAPESERYKYNLNIASKERPASPPRPASPSRQASPPRPASTLTPKSRDISHTNDQASSYSSNSDMGSASSSKYTAPCNQVKDKLSMLQSKIFGKCAFQPKSGPIGKATQTTTHEELMNYPNMDNSKLFCSTTTHCDEKPQKIEKFTLDELRLKIKEVSYR